jgi:hypothetical protein
VGDGPGSVEGVVLGAKHDGLRVRDALKAGDELGKILLLGQPGQGHRDRDDDNVAIDWPGIAEEGLKSARVSCLHVPGGSDGRVGTAEVLAVQQRIEIGAEQRAITFGEGERPAGAADRI